MSGEHRNLQTISRRNFAKSLLPAVLAIQLTQAPRVEAQRKKQEPPRRKQARRETSPITVGGGGGGRPGGAKLPLISIYFDHNWFKKDNPADPNQYWNSTDELKKLWITDDWGMKQHYPANKTFTIHCLRISDQQDSPITVTAKPLGISFNEGDYPYNTVRGVHYCFDRQITSIDIDGQPAVFTANDGICNIDIDDPDVS